MQNYLDATTNQSDSVASDLDFTVTVLSIENKIIVTKIKANQRCHLIITILSLLIFFYNFQQLFGYNYCR